MLEGVLAPGGTASEVSIPGYQLAGKTGTASKIDPATRRILQERLRGLVHRLRARRRPQAADARWSSTNRRSGSIFGGTVAAPAFGQIMSFALRYLGIAPELGAALPAPAGAETRLIRMSAREDRSMRLAELRGRAGRGGRRAR